MQPIDPQLHMPAGPQELVVFVGIPGSGKSSFYRRYFAASHAHVSLDVLRRRERERQLIQDYLAAGRSVVVDNTNVLRAERAVYLKLARQFDVPARCLRFTISLKEALRRNAARQGRARIPDVGVISKYKLLEEPGLDEGFSQILHVPAEELPL